MVAPSVATKEVAPGSVSAAAAANHRLKLPKPLKIAVQPNGLKVIMNPAFLTIISHLPNKCILSKSEKYVVNGSTVPPGEKPPPPSTKKKPLLKFKRYAGLVLAILSSMMFSFTGLIVKIISHHHPLTQATWMFVATFLLAIPLNVFKYSFEYYNRRKSSGGLGSGTFKLYPDNIEPISGGKIPSDSEPKDVSIIAISNAKSQTGLPSLVPSPSGKDPPTRDGSERMRQIKQLVLLMVRACAGCTGMIVYFYSLKYLSVGDSLVIVCSSPVFVFIIGYLFLGENCGVIPVVTIIMSMAGVAVITRPPMLTGKESFDSNDMIGAGLAFTSMLCIAITIVTMRYLQNVYHGLINLIFGFWGTLQTTTLALALGVLDCPHNFQDAVLMTATGAVFFLGQTFLALALQLEEAGPVSLVRTSEVVFAFVWQFIFLQVSPDIYSFSGAALILGGILLTICRKWISSLPENSAPRKMFGILLR